MPRIGSSDLDVFPLSLGGNVFGWTADRQASYDVLDAFVAAGGNFIDTADGYSAWVPGNTGGDSEMIIGDWIADRAARDSVVVATKVSQHPDFRGLAPANVAAACEASLKRLGTDRIDLYYGHFDDPDTPLEDTAAAFSRLVDEGKVRWIGISNYSPERVQAWLDIAAREGLHTPVALQPHYNLVAREPYESAYAPLVAAHHLGVAPYYALAGGFLTGKYRTEADLEGKERGATVRRYFSEAGLDVVSVLDDVAAAHGTSPTAVALAWLRARPGVVAPIASARNVDQLADLLASATLTLTDDETSRLDDVSATVARPAA